MQLPYSDELEIQHLSRLFDNTSECYKFFWFQAIVTKVLEGKSVLTYEELIGEMIADAWYMVTEYHLNLGPRDTLERVVHDIQKISGMKSSDQEIVKGWLQYNMILYLQKRNPSVPGIADKLYPPQERKLEKVKHYWKVLLSLQPMQEIYGHNRLDVESKDISYRSLCTVVICGAW